MRRTPIQRRTPLRAKTPLRRSRGPRPYRPKKEKQVPDAVATAVKRRSGGICERCTVRPATELHHRLTRARGGPHDTFNLVDLCAECHHVWAHGQNEHPWIIPGRIIRGVYTGPDPEYEKRYPPAA